VYEPWALRIIDQLDSGGRGPHTRGLGGDIDRLSTAGIERAVDWTACAERLGRAFGLDEIALKRGTEMLSRW